MQSGNWICTVLYMREQNQPTDNQNLPEDIDPGTSVVATDSVEDLAAEELRHDVSNDTAAAVEHAIGKGLKEMVEHAVQPRQRNEDVCGVCFMIVRSERTSDGICIDCA